MKSRILKSSLLVGLLLVFSFSTLLQTFASVLSPGTASAAGEQYAFYYPNNTATLGAINDKLRDGDPASEAENTIVYAKGGFWSRLNGAKLSEIPFNRAVSNGANDGRGEDRFDVDMKGQDDDQYIFTTDYLCYNNGSTLVADQSKGGEISRKSSFFYVSVAVVVELGETFQDRQSYDTSVFPLWVKKYDQFTVKQEQNGEKRQYKQWALGAYVDSAGDVFGQGFPPEEPKNNGDHFGNSVTKLYNDANLTDAVKSMRNDSGLNGGCIPPEATDYQLTTDNYWKNQKAWPQVTQLRKQGKTPEGSNSGSSGSGGEPELECDTKFFSPLSWISCPLIDGLSTVVSELDSLITSQLSAGSPGNGDNPSQIFCSGETEGSDLKGCEAYHKAWTVFRNLALGLLVIIGLVMIISEMAGMEIFDAYTIRKTLPRLVVGAIGISLSWQLMQFLVEFTNALGYGIRFLIYQPFVADGSGLDTVAIQGGGQGAVSLLAIGGLFFLGVIGMLSFVATAAIGVIVAFLTLIVREIIIIACVLVAPIAIVLYILPNTERFYKMWWDTFFKALMMFPLIAAMIAAGRVFATIASSTGGTISNILAVAAYFAPYFMLPMTFKMSGAAIAGIGGFLNNNELTNTGRKGLAQYRGRKRQENWQKAKNFERFGTGNRFTRGLSTAAGVVTSPKASLGKNAIPNVRNAKRTAAAREKLKGSAIWAEQQNNDSFTVAVADREFAETKLQQQRDALKNITSQQGWDKDPDQMAKAKGIEADINAREQGLALASSMGSLANDQGVRALALEQTVGSGYQFSPGEKGYEEIRGIAGSIYGTNSSALAGAMDQLQYTARSKGQRGDLGGIDHGGSVDLRTGFEKIHSYQRGQGKKETYFGAAQGFLGKGVIDADTGKTLDDVTTPDGRKLSGVERMSGGIAASVARGEASHADIAKYHRALLKDAQSASDANLPEIEKQIAAIESYAGGMESLPADASDAIISSHGELEAAINENKARMRAGVPEAERQQKDH